MSTLNQYFTFFGQALTIYLLLSLTNVASDKVGGWPQDRKMRVCVGDFNNDYYVGPSDYLMFLKFLYHDEQVADINFDGRVNYQDLMKLVAETGRCTPCANGVSRDSQSCKTLAQLRYETICKRYECVEASAPLPNQIIVHPNNRRWLAYADGRPFYLAGAGDPEEFLYRGHRNADGTRSGDQIELIEKLSRYGANGIYFQMVRSHGGDDKSERNHNPFVDGDPDKGLDSDILDQWEQWFSMMDRKGVVMLMFFYDDSARVWTRQKNGLTSDEVQFIRSMVTRFKHHTHLIWVIAEEYQEAFSATEASEFAAHIRAVDDRRHPIAIHKNPGKGFYEFYYDDNIDQYAMQYSDLAPSEYNAAINREWQRSSTARQPYNLNQSEAPGDWSGTEGRLKAWASAMAGAYVMIFNMDIASTPPADIKMLGYLRDFMESVPITMMAPQNELAADATEYVMGETEKGAGYVLYTSQKGPLGISYLKSGAYVLDWFDPVIGSRYRKTTKVLTDGHQRFTRPAQMGSEAIAYLRLQRVLKASD